MRFLRRIAGILGFIKDEPNEEQEDEHHHHHQQRQHHNHHHQQQHRGENDEDARRASRGFSVQVPVGPVLTRTHLGDGGVQGLKWYANRLRIDEDGDVADEFLDEIIPEIPEMPSNAADDNKRPIPKFELKYRTRPAKVRRQLISDDGKVKQSVEYHGRLLLV